MTDQVQDYLTYKEKTYYPQSDDLFRPEDFGFEVTVFSSDNLKGFQCVFVIENNKLILNKLIIAEQRNSDDLTASIQTFNGVYPSNKDGELTYQNLNFPVTYTGEYLVCDQLINEYNTATEEVSQPKYWLMIFNEGYLASFTPYDVEPVDRQTPYCAKQPTLTELTDADWEDLASLLKEPPGYLKSDYNQVKDDTPVVTGPDVNPFENN